MITQPGTSSQGKADQGIRRLLDARLSPPVSDEELKFLELQRLLEEIETAPAVSRQRSAVLARAVQTVRDLRTIQGEALQEAPRDAAPMAVEDGQRRFAVSRLLAIEAERDPGVAGFRERHLSGHLLAWKDIGEWINKQAELEGEPSRYVEIVLPPEANLRSTLAGLVTDSATPLAEVAIEGGVRAKVLRYGLPNQERTIHQPVRAGGVLDELRMLSETLAHSFSWQEDQATVFVLSGVTPYLVGVRLETDVQSEHPAASRVSLVIDPVVSPHEVLVAYSGLRQQVLEGTYRPLSEKHLKLAVFAAERRPPAKWSEVMQAWNEEHPELSYSKETVFARDCSAAKRRLLRPRLNPDALI